MAVQPIAELQTAARKEKAKVLNLRSTDSERVPYSKRGMAVTMDISLRVEAIRGIILPLLARIRLIATPKA